MGFLRPENSLIQNYLISLTIKQGDFSKLLVSPLFQPFEFLLKIITVDIDAHLGPVLFIPQKVFQILCPDIPKELFYCF